MENPMDKNALFTITYGLYIAIAHADGKENGCIIDTVMQITDDPVQICIAVNKNNLTHDMIAKSKMFNICPLSQNAPAKIFAHFGYQSGHNVDKFKDLDNVKYASNGIPYLTKNTVAYLSAEVFEQKDFGTHTLFLAKVTEAKVLSNDPSVTYSYYHKNIKEDIVSSSKKEKKKGFICQVCGYIYEGESLPEDFICPVCKRGAEVFVPI